MPAYFKNGHGELPKGEKTRWWVFTNYNLEFNYAALIVERASYIAYGLETAPTTGRKHHQGWIRFKHETGSKKNVAKHLGNCHVEPMVGTLSQNDDYCQKESHLVVFGNKPSQGERKDIRQILEEVKGGRSQEDIIEENPDQWVQYGRRFEEARAVFRNKKRTWLTEVIIYYGPPGTGKSLCANMHWPDADKCTWDGRFMNGYTQNDTVILEEYTGGVPYCLFNQMVDRYGMTINVKNGKNCQWNPRTLVMTTNEHPQNWYNNAAWGRRLKEICRVITLEKPLIPEIVKIQKLWRGKIGRNHRVAQPAQGLAMRRLGFIRNKRQRTGARTGVISYKK